MNSERRIVLLHTQGSYPGLRQIWGIWHEGEPIPLRAEGFEVYGRTTSSVFTGAFPRHLLYTEESGSGAA